MRMEFPGWEYGDPIGWISRAEIFFRFHKTLEKSKVDIASIQLEGDAIQRYELYKTYHGAPSWGSFRPSEYENINGQLIKIRQTSTIQEYRIYRKVRCTGPYWHTEISLV
ncbi:hypothetical protein BHE74_00018317 [Ensete ventricosum]|nr:hypothetical protein BHE74_00018317 [Ensete ventricosum]